MNSPTTNLKVKSVHCNLKPHKKIKKLRYHPNGRLEYSGPLAAGLKYGFGKELYENGYLHYEGDFRKNGPHGEECYLYHPNGFIDESG